MSHSFQSAHALVMRGHFHLQEFAAGEKLYAQQFPPTILRERDPQTGWETFKAKITAPIPMPLVVVAFDAINCLRSALDYTVYTATGIITGVDDPHQTKFPFGDDHASAEDEFERGGRGVPACIRDFLLDFEPYRTRNKTLWAFNQIRNSKIHRALAPMAHASSSVGMMGNGDMGLFAHLDRWDSRNQELTFAEGRDIGDGFNPRVTVNVAFSERTHLPLQPVLSTLAEIKRVCAGVVTGVEAETARIMAARSV